MITSPAGATTASSSGPFSRSSSGTRGTGEEDRTRPLRRCPSGGSADTSQPLRPFGPPPHEWGGQGRSCPSGPAGHLPMNGEDKALRPPPALREELPLRPCGGPPLRRHLPLRRFAPLPHEWGGD